MKRNYYGIIGEKRRHLIGKAKEAKELQDFSKKADLEMRIKYLTTLRRSLVAPKSQVALPAMFISYSKSRGSLYFKIAQEISKEFGFEALTGFDYTHQTNVLRVVVETIKKASVFLSILTPDYQIRSTKDDGEMKTAPSVWLIEEKGMALALGKPFRLLVHESVHEDFWLRTTPGFLHTQYSDDSFKEKAREAIQALANRYDEILLTEPESRQFDDD